MWVTLINDHPRAAFSLGHPHIWPSHIHKVAIETPWDPQTLLQMGEYRESQRNPTSHTFCPCWSLLPIARSHRAGLRCPAPRAARSRPRALSRHHTQHLGGGGVLWSLLLGSLNLFSFLLSFPGVVKQWGCMHRTCSTRIAEPPSFNGALGDAHQRYSPHPH